jgi:hypothetical protein
VASPATTVTATAPTAAKPEASAPKVFVFCWRSFHGRNQEFANAKNNS